MPIAVLKKSYVRETLSPDLTAAPDGQTNTDHPESASRLPTFNTVFWRNPGILLSSIAINLLSLALPLAMLQVFERIIPNQALDTFAYLLLGLFCIILIDGVLRIARSYSVAWQGSRFEHAVSCQIVGRLTETSLEKFEESPVGRHLERLQSVETLRDFYSGSALINMLEIPFLILFLALIALIGGYLALAPIGLFLLCGGIGYLLGERLKQRIEQRNKLDMQRFNFILEVLNAMQHVKSQALEAFMLRRYERLQATCAIENSELTRLSATAHGLGAFFSYFVLFATAAVAAYMVLDGRLSQGEMAACSLLAGRATQPFLRSLAFWNEHQSVRIAKEDMRALMAHEPESKADARKDISIDGAIAFESATMAFDGNTVLDAVNLQIQPGETVLIDGAMGSGKSTMMKLACGIVRPTSGLVRLNDVDIAALSVTELRRDIAYLPEKAVMFRGTILDNLTLFDHERNLDRAMEISAELGLDRLFARLPDGFETEIGDDLAELTPLGIRQQIGIVRALAQRPKIILFDQPNGGLDMDSDQRLTDLLRSMKGEFTLLMSTPRRSYRDLADRVVVINKDGAVRQAGLPAGLRDRIRPVTPGLRIKLPTPETNPRPNLAATGARRSA